MENLADGEGDMKDWGQAYLSTHGGGSGAYKVVSHNPQEETVMARNADYFLGVPAKAPDTVRLRYGLEAATVRTLVAQGEHDITSQWLPPEVLKALAADGAQLLTKSGGCRLLRQDEHDQEAARRRQLPHGADLRIRLRARASRWWRSPTRSRKAARRPARCRSACSARCRPPTPTSATSTRRRNISPNCKYKPEDFNLELSWVGEVPLEERFALLMQANFAEIGIKSEVKKIPWALFSEQVTKPENTPNISQVFVNAVTGDPDTLIYGMYHSSAAGTWQSPEYLKDAKVDELLDKGRTRDVGRRARGRLHRSRQAAARARADHLRVRPEGGVRGKQARVGAGAVRPGQGVRPERHGLHLPPDGNDRIGRSEYGPAVRRRPVHGLPAPTKARADARTSASWRSGWERP